LKITRPATTIADGGSKPIIVRANVLLPAPLSPTRQKICPSSCTKSTPFRALTWPIEVSKCTCRFSTFKTSAINYLLLFGPDVALTPALSQRE
jgi:hypothetical protein